MASGSLVFKINVLLANKIDDFCLEPGKIKVLKMLDLQTKSAINSDKLRVQQQARSQATTTML